MFFTLSAHADALSIPHQIATQIGMGIPRFFVKWGDNLPLIYSAFTSGVVLNMYGVSVAKDVKNLPWIVLFSLPLYLISTALINALQGVQ